MAGIYFALQFNSYHNSIECISLRDRNLSKVTQMNLMGEREFEVEYSQSQFNIFTIIYWLSILYISPALIENSTDFGN